MRICFFGTPEPAVPSLRALLQARDVDVAAVVTNPDRPKGRGHALAPSPVKVAAADAGVPVWQPSMPREILAEVAALEPDACAVVAYGALLPGDLLAAGGAGYVNLHFSLLPAWRGAAPVAHAIAAGDTETGVTCFLLDTGMDTGPVLTSTSTPIGPEETAGELTTRLAELGAPLLVEALRGLVDGSLRPQPQPLEGVSYAPKLTSENARLDWLVDAEVLGRAVRAYNPVPGAYTTYDGGRLKVHRARPVDGEGAPGAVLRVDPDDGEAGGPVVACGRAALRLEEVQPAGRPRMSGTAFARGHAVAGVVLG